MEQMRLFASNIKELQQERIGAPRAGGPVRVGLCRDSAPHNSVPQRGLGGGEQRWGTILLIIFSIFSLLDVWVIDQV